MWLIILWLFCIPKLLYNFILTFALLLLFVCYKVFGSCQRQASASRQLQEQLERQQQFIVTSGGQLKDKIKFAMLRGTRAMRGAEQRVFGGARAAAVANGRHRQQEEEEQQQQQPNNQSGFVNHNNNNQSGASGERANRFYLASLALACGILLVACCHLPQGAHGLEQDAEILKPLANMAKAVIKTVTLGVPLEIQFDPTGLAKNFAYFTWRTGFPVSMPSGFVPKAQNFYNRVKARVDAADVSEVERKSLSGLKRDLDDIVDGIVEEVRRSPRGLYTDYLETQVNGVPLEDACVAVGTQLKAYGVDLTNYRNIAGMVLGIPVMPTVASAVMNVRNLASLDAMRNLTATFHPMSLARLPGSALGTLDNLRQQAPMQNLVQMPLNVVQAPLSLLSSGQRFLAPGSQPRLLPAPELNLVQQPLAVA